MANISRSTHGAVRAVEQRYMKGVNKTRLDRDEVAKGLADLITAGENAIQRQLLLLD